MPTISPSPLPKEPHSLLELALQYRHAQLEPVTLCQHYLQKLEQSPQSIYSCLCTELAQQQAQQASDDFALGIDTGFLQGIPLIVKDILDIRQEITCAGSKILSETRQACKKDARIVHNLSKAGAVILGKSHMTELAYSGLGINPHFGTPDNALAAGHIPGGSSSGSAVAVAQGLACVAIGSDTGGSVRIPAAFNGLVGLKTENGTLPTQGVTHLSPSLDTIGVLAHTVADAFYTWQGLKGTAPEQLQLFHSASIIDKHFVVPHELLSELDASIAASFTDICLGLQEKGVHISYQSIPELEEISEIYQRHGNFAAHESAALYANLLPTGKVDARVASRIRQGLDRPASDYIHLQLAQRELVKRFWRKYANVDAFLAPTVPILPPKFSDVVEDSAYYECNRLSLRNTMPFNFLTGPAVSVPCGNIADTPFSLGVMLACAPRRYQSDSHHAAEIGLLSMAQSLQGMTLKHPAPR